MTERPGHPAVAPYRRILQPALPPTGSNHGWYRGQARRYGHAPARAPDTHRPSWLGDGSVVRYDLTKNRRPDD